LDRFYRADMNAPDTELAVMFPDRSAIHKFDILCRADGCTCSARSTFVIDREFSVIVMDMG